MTTAGLHPALEPIETLDWPRLDAFLGERIPEEERLDYKDLVSPSLAETAAAMANGRGGTIVVGVREASPPHVPGTWEGAPGDVQQAARNTLWYYCNPGISVQFAPVEHPRTGNRLLVIAVSPALLPPIWHRDRGVLLRVGDQNRPAPPEMLEAWYRARSEGNASEAAMRIRASAASMYGAPGFGLLIWPIVPVPPVQFRPDTDRELDLIAAVALEPDQWTGRPMGNEYLLEAGRNDRILLTAVGQEAFVRFKYEALRQPPATQVDLVEGAGDLLKEYARRLAFAEVALERVCFAPAPLRVELVMNYGSSWRIAPPASGVEFSDPALPSSISVETPAIVESNMDARSAAGTSKDLLVGTLRRLGWRSTESLVGHLTAHLPDSVTKLYERLDA